MNLSGIRQYINSVISGEYPDLVEWQDALNIENIPNTLIDLRYHILVGPVAITHDDDVVNELVQVVLTIFKRAFNDTVGARDYILDISNCIVMDLINPSTIGDYDQSIQDVEASSISISEINETNDNILKSEISLNFKIAFNAL